MGSKVLARTHGIDDKVTRQAIRSLESTLNETNSMLGALAAAPAVTGSRGGNAALASLLTALAGLGLITDSTTA